MGVRKVVAAAASMLLASALLVVGSSGAAAVDSPEVCGVVPYANETGWIPAESVQAIMASATPVPVSGGVGASGYVTYTPGEAERIDLYIVADVPYEGDRTERTWSVPLGALFATPAFAASQVTELRSGYGFTPEEYPGYSIEVDGQSLLINSPVGQGFQLDSGEARMSIVYATITPRPIAAECPEPEEPVIVSPEPEEPIVSPEPSTPTVEPEPQPEDPPAVAEPVAPIEKPEPKDPPASRSVPKAVKTGVGPVDATPAVQQNVASLLGAWNAEDSVAPTVRELLAMLKNAQPQPAPVLSLPAPRTMAFADELEPTTFQDLWVIDDPGKGYSTDGAQFFLAHTHTRGGAIGNAVNEAGLTPGTAIEIAGLRYDVTNVSTVVKADIGTLPIWHAADPDDAFLIVCLWNNGSLATHNLVIEMHRA